MKIILQETEKPISLRLESLVSKALSQGKLSALSEVLKSIGEAVPAYGCVLWQVNRSEKRNIRPDRLFVISEWFHDERSFALYDLPLHGSVTGIAALKGETINIEDIWKDKRVYTKDPFLSKAGITSMCCVPIRFRDGAIGSLNIYRNGAPALDRDEVTHAEMLASLLPSLYQAIRDEVSLSLIASTTKLLYSAESTRGAKVDSIDAPMSEAKMKKVMRKVCDLVSACFQSIETSIFLENRLKKSDEYRLIATTWPRRGGNKVLRKSDRGLTAWVLREGRSVRLFDLSHFDRDKAAIHSEYPNLEWADSLDVATMIPESLSLKFGEEPPPLSYMAVPIVNRAKVYGVIRCAVAERGPYYFTERDLALLQLIGTQLGHSWSDWLSKCELREERNSWTSFVDGIGKLNQFVSQQLQLGNVDMDPLFDRALQFAKKTIDGAEILDVRTRDESGTGLRFRRTLGDAWNQGDSELIEKRLSKRFPIDIKPPPSAGARVFQTGETCVIRDVREDVRHDPYDATFAETTCMIIAPIRVQDNITGVLDIRGVGTEPFPKYAEYKAALLGQQLGLYSYLSETVGALRDQEVVLSDQASALERIKNEQIQTFQDLTHQFRTPIRQANAWLTEAIENISIDDQVVPLLWKVRGLTAKAKRVSANTELFADLARGAQLELENTHIRLHDLLRLLKEANQDAQNLVLEHRNVSFYVDEISFTHPKKRLRFIQSLYVDRGLLEQAIGDLLENAAKYSYRDTQVRVHGGWTSTGRFHISVENEGIPISLAESKECCTHGWQGELAKEMGRGGKGIGLWIVDHIMKSHGGYLQVLPTAAGLTNIRMIFPEERVQ